RGRGRGAGPGGRGRDPREFGGPRRRDPWRAASAEGRRRRGRGRHARGRRHADRHARALRAPLNARVGLAPIVLALATLSIPALAAPPEAAATCVRTSIGRDVPTALILTGGGAKGPYEAGPRRPA